MAQTPFRSVVPPTSEDWEDRRGLITRLYLEEDKPLKDVMVLVNVGGFKASEKMYHTRIKEWGITKKTKEHEARAIIRLHHQRLGNPTEIFRRGRPVDIRRAESYLKRKGISVEDVLSSSSRSSCVPDADLDLKCRTPSPVENQAASHGSTLVKHNFHEMSSGGVVWSRRSIDAPGAIATRVELPDGLKIVECMFVDIRDFIMGSIQHRNPHSGLTASSMGPSVNLLGKLYDILAYNSEKLGYLHVHTSYKSKLDDGALALGWLFNVILGLLWRGDTNMAFRISKVYSTELALIAKANFSVMVHRLGRVFHWISRLLDMEEPVELISQSTLRVMVDTSKCLVPPMATFLLHIFNYLQHHMIHGQMVLLTPSKRIG